MFNIIHQNQLFRALFFLCLIVFSTIKMNAASATSLVLNILDSAGQGLNDNTSTIPVGGNTGTTIGEQRRIAFAFAADLLETVLNSSVDISIDASFTGLTCSANSATLGQGGPNSIYRHNSTAATLPLPQSNTWYVEALANSYNGSDLSASADMFLTFNSNIDNNNNCLNNRNWYYGLDGNTPATDIDFLSTVLHEMIHGLGFITLTNIISGSLSNNYDDSYSLFLEDHSLGNNWAKNQMNDTQRATSAIDDPDLHWNGSNVQAASSILTAGIDQNHVRMHAPSTLSSISSVSHFSTALSPNQLMEPVLTEPAQNIGLAEQLLKDIGWNTFNDQLPLIAAINDITLLNATTGNIDLVILDNDTTPVNLVVSASSSNTNIVSNANLIVSGNDRLRQLNITPEASMTGLVQITVSVNDGSNINNTTLNVDVVADLVPVLFITSPSNNSAFYASPQLFTATATDNEDGDISAQISWSSSLDGNLNNGASINTSLTDGNHTISASITDSDSNNVIDNIDIVVSLAGDADGDGLINSLEISLGTDPNDSDSDNDLASDFIEVNRDGNPNSYTPGVDTDPNNSDTDGDGYLDGYDIDPLDPESVQISIPATPNLALYILLGLFGFIRQRNK